MRMVRDGQATWVSSLILNIEVNRNPDSDRRRDAQALLSFANEVLVPVAATADRAAQIEQLGFGAFDALHLAAAEQGGVEVLLTTDDGLLRCARRSSSPLHLRVENPVSWYQEVRR
jgi:predicted nucleic acid-binding protein